MLTYGKSSRYLGNVGSFSTIPTGFEPPFTLGDEQHCLSVCSPTSCLPPANSQIPKYGKGELTNGMSSISSALLDMSVNITPSSTMALTEHGDDVFEDCVEEPSATSHNPPTYEQPGVSPSSLAIANGDRVGGSSSPQTRNQRIQEKFQAARVEYENKRYVACREKSMELLRQRNLPPITRCLTLQLFASCSYYYGAKHALEQALIIAHALRDLDPDRVLRKDVEGLLEDLEQYRPKDGAPRQYIEELEFDDH